MPSSQKTKLSSLCKHNKRADRCGFCELKCRHNKRPNRCIRCQTECQHGIKLEKAKAECVECMNDVQVIDDEANFTTSTILLPNDDGINDTMFVKDPLPAGAGRFNSRIHRPLDHRHRNRRDCRICARVCCEHGCFYSSCPSHKDRWSKQRAANGDNNGTKKTRKTCANVTWLKLK